MIDFTKSTTNSVNQNLSLIALIKVYTITSISDKLQYILKNNFFFLNTKHKENFAMVSHFFHIKNTKSSSNMKDRSI